MPRGDSISRYESYDLLNTHRVQRRNDGRVTAGSIRDTVETSEEKQTRFSPPKVAPTDSRFSQDRLVFAGKAGRFVFMTICMPPYLLLYGMPKWVLVSVVPHIIKASGAALNFGANLALNIKNWAVEALMKPFRDAFGKINFAVQNIAKGLAGLLSNLRNAITKPFIAAFKGVNKVINNIAGALKNTVLKTTPLLEAIKHVFSKAFNHAKKATDALKTPFTKTAAAFTHIGHHLGNIGTHAQDAASKLSKKVEEITKVLSKKMRSAAESLNESKVKVQQFIAFIPSITVIPMINLFIQMRNTIGEYGKFSLKRIKNTGKSLLNARKRVKSALEGSKKFLANLPKKAKEKMAKTINWARGPLVEFIKEEIPFLYDAYLFFKRMINKLISIIQAIKAFIQKVLGFLLSFIKKKQLAIKALGTRAQNALKKAALSSAHFMQKGLRKRSLSLLQSVQRIGRAVRELGKAFVTLFKELHHEVRSWIS